MAMATRSVATVFGGSGFIGRYVVKRLAARRQHRARRGARPGGGAVPQADGRGRADRAAVRPGAPTTPTVHARGRGRGLGGQPGRHPGRAPRRRFPARPRRRRRARGAPSPAAAGVRASRASLGDRRRSGEPQPLRAEQGGRRGRRCARRSRRRRSCAPRSCSGRRTSSSTASPRMAQILPFMPVIAGAHADAAGLRRRRRGRGDRRAARGRTAAGKTYELGGPAGADHSASCWPTSWR